MERGRAPRKGERGRGWVPVSAGQRPWRHSRSRRPAPSGDGATRSSRAR